MSDLWTWLNPRSTLGSSRDWVKSTHPALTAEDVKAALGGLAERPFLFGMAAFLGDARSLHRLETILIHELQTVGDCEGWVTKRQHFEIVERMGALMLFEVISARSRAEAMPGDDTFKQRNVAHVLCPACRGKGSTIDLYRVCPDCEGRKWERNERRVVNGQAYQIFSAGPVQPCRGCDGRGSVLAKKDQAARCGLCHATGRFVLTDRRRAEAVGLHLANWMRTWSGRYAEQIETPRLWEHRAVAHVKRMLR